MRSIEAHGWRIAWCSIRLVIIVCLSPHDSTPLIAQLSLSVPPDVKKISSGEALIHAAIAVRASFNAFLPGERMNTVVRRFQIHPTKMEALLPKPVHLVLWWLHYPHKSYNFSLLFTDDIWDTLTWDIILFGVNNAQLLINYGTHVNRRFKAVFYKILPADIGS